MDLRSLRYFLTVVDEGNVGRAAGILHMTQPPLSRAVRGLEEELGVTLLHRTSRGVTPTAAGRVMAAEARSLLAHAEVLSARVLAAAGPPTLTIGTLADSVARLDRLVTAFGKVNPQVSVVMHEADLGDPTAGLRSGTVDVALTRTPFDTSGIAVRALLAEPVGVVLPVRDRLALRDSVTTTELADRRWVRLPGTADEQWRDYWTPHGADAETPVCRTIEECLQSVLWNRAAALAPLGQRLPDGLTAVPVADRAPSELVVAWPAHHPGPLVRSFVRSATQAYGQPGRGAARPGTRPAVGTSGSAGPGPAPVSR